jgi:hypothetical protein
MVIDNNTGDIISFTSARKAAEFIGVHHSYVAKSLGKLGLRPR